MQRFSLKAQKSMEYWIEDSFVCDFYIYYLLAILDELAINDKYSIYHYPPKGKEMLVTTFF